MTQTTWREISECRYDDKKEKVALIRQKIVLSALEYSSINYR